MWAGVGHPRGDQFGGRRVVGGWVVLGAERSDAVAQFRPEGVCIEGEGKVIDRQVEWRAEVGVDEREAQRPSNGCEGVVARLLQPVGAKFDGHWYLARSVQFGGVDAAPDAVASFHHRNVHPGVAEGSRRAQTGRAGTDHHHSSVPGSRAPGRRASPLIERTMGHSRLRGVGGFADQDQSPVDGFTEPSTVLIAASHGNQAPRAT